jgi:hypothetical protein
MVISGVKIDKKEDLILPRLDTNDLPKESNATPNEWTRSILT